MDGLFEFEPAQMPGPGETVIVQTIWGDEEGTVTQTGYDEWGPLLTVHLARGDTATIHPARVRPA